MIEYTGFHVLYVAGFPHLNSLVKYNFHIGRSHSLRNTYNLIIFAVYIHIWKTFILKLVLRNKKHAVFCVLWKNQYGRSVSAIGLHFCRRKYVIQIYLSKIPVVPW